MRDVPSSLLNSIVAQQGSVAKCFTITMARFPSEALVCNTAGTGKGGKSIFPTANGKFADEIIDHANLKHSKRGVVSMANSGPNTNGRCTF